MDHVISAGKRELRASGSEELASDEKQWEVNELDSAVEAAEKKAAEGQGANSREQALSNIEDLLDKVRNTNIKL